VARPQQLTEAQITELFDPPSDQRELVRHYTLSAADFAAIRRCRGDHNRLGHALMLCYLRYPGRPLHADKRPPGPLPTFVTDQIGVIPESVENYLVADRNRRCTTRPWQSRWRSRCLSAGRPIWTSRVSRQPGIEWTLQKVTTRTDIHHCTVYRWLRQGHLRGHITARGDQRIWIIEISEAELDHKGGRVKLQPKPDLHRNPT
jgi:Domain of unknown function (DUF4158)